MNIKKRLANLEAATKVKTIKVDIIRTIMESDGTISGGIRRSANGECISLSDGELKEMQAIN